MSDDKIKFYNIEAEHLADLKKVARRLLNARPDTESRMSGEELRDAAVTIMCVVNYAEVLDALRGANPEAVYVHLNTKVSNK